MSGEHEWIESDWPDDPEPMCKWCRLSKSTIGDDDCVGPSVEQMIEELCADGETICIGTHEEGWVTWIRDGLYIGGGESPREAFAALYRAWRERE